MARGEVWLSEEPAAQLVSEALRWVAGWLGQRWGLGAMEAQPGLDLSCAPEATVPSHTTSVSPAPFPQRPWSKATWDIFCLHGSSPNERWGPGTSTADDSVRTRGGRGAAVSVTARGRFGPPAGSRHTGAPMWAVAPTPADGKCPRTLRLGVGGE